MARATGVGDVPRVSYEQVLRLYLPDTIAAEPLTRALSGPCSSGLRRVPRDRIAARAEERKETGEPPERLSLRTVAYCRAALRLVLEEAVGRGTSPVTLLPGHVCCRRAHGAETPPLATARSWEARHQRTRRCAS